MCSMSCVCVALRTTTTKKVHFCVFLKDTLSEGGQSWDQSHATPISTDLVAARSKNNRSFTAAVYLTTGLLAAGWRKGKKKKGSTPANLRLTLPSIKYLSHQSPHRAKADLLLHLPHPSETSLPVYFRTCKWSTRLILLLMLSVTSEATTSHTNQGFMAVFTVIIFHSNKCTECSFCIKAYFFSCLPHTPRGWAPSRSHMLTSTPLQIPPSFLILAFQLLFFTSASLHPFSRNALSIIRGQGSSCGGLSSSLSNKSLLQRKFNISLIHISVTTADSVSTRLELPA